MANQKGQKNRKITIKKEDLLPRERAPIIPSKKFEEKSRKTERRAKYKKDPRRLPEEDSQ
ncbi:MAG: hypothetical protein ACREDR_15060 [Blastocatellia bacterium]